MIRKSKRSEGDSLSRNDVVWAVNGNENEEISIAYYPYPSQNLFHGRDLHTLLHYAVAASPAHASVEEFDGLCPGRIHPSPSPNVLHVPVQEARPIHLASDPRLALSQLRQKVEADWLHALSSSRSQEPLRRESILRPLDLGQQHVWAD